KTAGIHDAFERRHAQYAVHGVTPKHRFGKTKRPRRLSRSIPVPNRRVERAKGVLGIDGGYDGYRWSRFVQPCDDRRPRACIPAGLRPAATSAQGVAVALQ